MFPDAVLAQETPVSNDINYRGALRREYQINDEAAKCPSPWLAKPTAAQMKERTELPIDHPYGGGLRWCANPNPATLATPCVLTHADFSCNWLGIVRCAHSLREKALTKLK